MEIPRDKYLNKLINQIDKPVIKIITGIRRCGKSYLLFKLFYDYLLTKGYKKEQIICINLESRNHASLRNVDNLYENIQKKIKGKNKKYFVFLDEVQYAISKDDARNKNIPLPIYDVLNDLLQSNNLDIYVTGSNSKFLSKDVMTEFRGRGKEIYVQPLSFSEYKSAHKGSFKEAWNDYLYYGGFPYLFIEKDNEEKANYLKNLYTEIYLKDIKERYNTKNSYGMEEILKVIASGIGSLTSPKRISDTFKSNGIKSISEPTISDYLEYLQDSFIIKKAERYDLKGRRYIGTNSKYYFADLGLRNSLLNFRQMEFTHLMENAIYNELIYRGFNVDVGIVEVNAVENNKKVRKQFEIDFIANKGGKRYYIQSAYNISDSEKLKQEQQSLLRVKDSFKKVIVTDSDFPSWFTDEGTLIIGLEEFLTSENSLDK